MDFKTGVESGSARGVSQPEGASSRLEKYQTEGYCVVRNLVPEELIDRLLKVYGNQIRPSKKHFFRQSSNRWQKNTLNESGYVTQSFRDPHDYPDFPEFSTALRNIICSREVRKAVAGLTGCPANHVVQSMMFDLNTATPAHQDCYYLDSLPGGHLLAGWFALEDIHEEAGRFFVIPKSNQVELQLSETEKASNGPYLERISAYMKEHAKELTAPALKKGDVLFWNSRTVHGSTRTIDPRHSRKSLTAHFLPGAYEFGNQLTLKPFPVDYAEHDGVKYRVVPPIHSQFSWKHKAQTDAINYLWYHPHLMKVAKKAWRLVKGKAL